MSGQGSRGLDFSREEHWQPKSPLCSKNPDSTTMLPRDTIEPGTTYETGNFRQGSGDCGTGKRLKVGPPLTTLWHITHAPVTHSSSRNLCVFPTFLLYFYLRVFAHNIANTRTLSPYFLSALVFHFDSILHSSQTCHHSIKNSLTIPILFHPLYLFHHYI